MKQKHGNSLFYICIACVIISSLTRVWYCLNYPVPVRDSYKYMQLIKYWDIYKELPKNNTIPPLSLFFLKIPSHFLPIDIITGGVVSNIVFGTLIVITSILIIGHFPSSKLLILITGIVVATHPTLVYYSCHMLRENSYLLFCFLIAYSIIANYNKRDYYHLMLEGIYAGMACLVRYESLEIIIIWLLLTAINPKKSKRAKLNETSLFLLSFVVTILLIDYYLDIPLRYYINSYYKVEKKVI